MSFPAWWGRRETSLWLTHRHSHIPAPAPAHPRDAPGAALTPQCQWWWQSCRARMRINYQRHNPRVSQGGWVQPLECSDPCQGLCQISAFFQWKQEFLWHFHHQCWWWERNFASKCSPHSKEGLKGLLSQRKEGWAGRDQGNQWATEDFRASRWVWAGSNTPEWGEFLFWTCSWRFPWANLAWNTVGREVNTLIYWNYLSKSTRLGRSEGWRIISLWNNSFFAGCWSWISAATLLFLLSWL